ncbi:neuronal acetylcholine receptor subunit alpha-10-like [Bacillus rossius redtenbacheri]|uniref:neuronal acetylcholine receptor subunit alpha-10-like n=1 Tax=Bacillus rossius redtenbacheri TaxID=93214 RepID=UPI002FDEE7B3
MRPRDLASLLALFATGLRAAAGTEQCDGPARQPQPTTVLRKSLLCNYDRLERPAKDLANATTVAVLLWLKSFDVNEMSHGHSIDIHTWTAWSWMDDYLTWDPKQHNGIEFLHFRSYEIWIPELVLQSPAEFQSLANFFSDGKCVVRHVGHVVCIASSAYHAQCDGDLASWPFDSHRCELVLTALEDKENSVNLTVMDTGISTLDLVPNRDWELVAVNASVSTEHALFGGQELSVLYEFTIRRHSSLYMAVILAPLLVLAVMTAVSFWISPDNTARVTLCCLNLVIHCLCLQNLMYVIGSNGETCPRIVLLYRDSLVLVLAALGTAVLAMRASRPRAAAAAPPPPWLGAAALLLVDNPLGRPLLAGRLGPQVFPRKQSGDEEAADIIENSEDIGPSKLPLDQWAFLVDVLDRAMFYVYLIVFHILLIARVS